MLNGSVNENEVSEQAKFRANSGSLAYVEQALLKHGFDKIIARQK